MKEYTNEFEVLSHKILFPLLSVVLDFNRTVEKSTLSLLYLFSS